MFGMGKSTAIAIVKQFLKAMRKHRNRFIKFPFTREELKQKIEEFKCLSKFPNVVGSIDGCHFEIPAHEENSADYFYRKQFYSLVLQALMRTKMFCTLLWASQAACMAAVFSGALMFTTYLKMDKF